MPSIQGAIPTNLIKGFTFTVPASSTGTQTLGAFSTEVSSWYFVRVTKDSDGAEDSFMLPVGRLLSGQPEDQLFSRLGEGSSFTFKVKLSGSDVIFEVVNSETSALTVNYIRIRK